MSRSLTLSFLAVGFAIKNLLGSHKLSSSPYTLAVRILTASWEIILGDANGMWYEFGVGLIKIGLMGLTTLSMWLVLVIVDKDERIVQIVSFR